jgi:hypothetical protein
MYRSLAKELAERGPEGEALPQLGDLPNVIQPAERPPPPQPAEEEIAGEAIEPEAIEPLPEDESIPEIAPPPAGEAALEPQSEPEPDPHSAEAPIEVPDLEAPDVATAEAAGDIAVAADAADVEAREAGVQGAESSADDGETSGGSMSEMAGAVRSPHETVGGAPDEPELVEEAEQARDGGSEATVLADFGRADIDRSRPAVVRELDPEPGSAPIEGLAEPEAVVEVGEPEPTEGEAEATAQTEESVEVPRRKFRLFRRGGEE